MSVCTSVRPYVRSTFLQKMLLLLHFLMDSFEIWYTATYKGPPSSNDPKIANLQFWNFLDFFFKIWLKSLLLLHFWTDLFEILHIAPCGHHQQLTDPSVGNFAILNFSGIFLIFFLKFDLNRYSSFISFQILLKLWTMQLEALLNNKMIQWFFIFLEFFQNFDLNCFSSFISQKICIKFYT